MKVLKELIFSVLVFLLMAQYGCKKEEQELNSFAYIGDTHLELEIDARLRDGQRLHFYMSHINGAGRRRFETAIYNVPAGIGDYMVNKDDIPGVPNTPYLFSVDNDVALDDYVLLSGENNTVSVTEIDADSRLVRGTFQLSFIRDTTPSSQKLDVFPDTLRLREGHFEVIYEEN